MARLFSLALLFVTAISAFAQRAPIDPPVVGRPAEFSNIVGNYTIDISAEPLEIPVEEPITLRIRITGAGPQKYEPRREFLRILPDWTDDFYVENAIDDDRVLPDEKTWLFVYRLRPKHTDVKEIDGLKFIYYDPDFRGKTKFVARPIDAMPITVTPKRDLTGVIETQSAVPDSFYRLDESPDALASSPPFSISLTGIALVLALPPIGWLIGLIVWRRIFPTAAQRQARQRSRSAQRALARLHTGEPPWVVVGDYLRGRFEFTVSDPTPTDVAGFLKRRGFAKECSRSAAAFFAQSDAVRYTDARADSQKMRDDGARLIQALEADPMRPLIAFAMILFVGAARAETRGSDEIRAAADASFRHGVLNKTKLLQARKDFADAADAYLELHRQGVRNPALYRNLGNAAALADRWPEAIWAYHMGLTLDPNQAGLREHLAFARAKVLYPTGGQGRLNADAWPSWLHRPTAGELFVAFALSYTLIWLVGTCAVFTRKGWLIALTIALILLALFSGIALRLDAERSETDRRTPLVVVADNTPFYLGNGLSYEQHKGAPLLPRGLEARLQYRRGEWVQIRLSTGEIGWLPGGRVLVVEP